MKSRIKRLVFVLFIFASSLSSFGWQPSGWVYHREQYAFSIDDGAWHYLHPRGRQWRVNLRTGAWGMLENDRGWTFYRWPYAYNFAQSAWTWFSPGNTLWTANTFTGEWSMFGNMPNGLSFAKLTDRMIFKCYPQDRNILPDIVRIIDTHYARIEGDLQSHLPERISLEIYPDINTFHQKIFGQSQPTWVAGSCLGWDYIAVVSPQNTGGYHNYIGVLRIAVHELTHALLNYRYSPLPVWLNEGFAEYLSQLDPAREAWYRDYVGKQSSKFTLQFMEDNWGETGSYQFAFSIADFLVSRFGWAVTRQFLATKNYALLGYASKADFQTAWHQFIDQNY
jgi:hypothetical protein